MYKMLNKYLKIFIIALILVMVDQAIKWWMMTYHPLLIVKNQGVIFGLLDNLLIAYSLLFIGLVSLFYLFMETKNQLTDLRWQSVFALILAGAISNLMDRFARGYIMDYWTIAIWSSFNLADIYILSGVILYYWLVLKKQLII